MALCLVNIPSETEGTICLVLGIEARLAACKASDLILCYLLDPKLYSILE